MIQSPSSSCASSVCSVTSNDLSDVSVSDVEDPRSLRRAAARKWSEDEDKRLKEAVDKFGLHKWKEVADFVMTRDATKCMQRWVKGLSPGLVKGRWSEDEDRALTSLVSAALAVPAPQGDAQPVIAWTQIAKSIPGRTSKQCRERWFNFLDPTLNKGPFTAEEDELLLELYHKKGRHWAQIAREMAGRTENVVKVRCLALLRKREENQSIASSASFSFPQTCSSRSDSCSVGGSSCKRGRNGDDDEEEEVESVTKKTRLVSLLLNDPSFSSVPSLTRASSFSSISVSPSHSRECNAPEEDFFFPLSLKKEEPEAKEEEEASEDIGALLFDLFPQSSQSQSSVSYEQPLSSPVLHAPSATVVAPSPAPASTVSAAAAPLVTPLPPSLSPLLNTNALGEYDLVAPFVYRPQMISSCPYVPLSVPVPPSPVPVAALPLAVPVPPSAVSVSMSLPVPTPPQGFLDSQFDEALDFLCARM